MDPVEEQEAAYNIRDLDRFVACYSSDVVVEDGDGNVLMKGHDGMRESYGALFEASPELHAHIAKRIKVGRYVIDEEEVTGINLPGFPARFHSAVVYRVEGDQITHVRLYS